MSDITCILQRAQSGDSHAAEELLPIVYQQLRQLAAAKMAKEPAGHTLQPTALVHEAWLRIASQNQQHWGSRAQFCAAASEMMRRILVDRARRRRAVRHGGGLERIDLDGIELPIESEPGVHRTAAYRGIVVEYRPRRSRSLDPLLGCPRRTAIPARTVRHAAPSFLDDRENNFGK